MWRSVLLSVLSSAALAAAGDVDELLSQAGAAEWRGEYAQARAHYETATEKYSDQATVWAAYGEHLRFYAQDAAAAERAFRRALQSQPDAYAEAFAWRGLGEIAAAQDREREALSYFNKSLKARPLADTYRSLCHFHVMKKDWQAAASTAKKAVKLAPDDPIAVLLYAAQLQRAGDVAAGRREQQRAFTLAGLDASGKPKPGEPVHCCVYYNAAGYFAVAADAPQALRLLAAFFATPNHRHLSRTQISADPDFTALRQTPEFQALLEHAFAAHTPAR